MTALDMVSSVTVAGIAAVLLIAGSSKIFSPNTLAESVIHVLSLPSFWKPSAIQVARLLGISEVAVALFWLVKDTRTIGAIATLVLVLGIVLVVLLAAYRKISVQCGCFGSSSTDPPLGWRNLIWAAGLGIVSGASLASPLTLQDTGVKTLTVLTVATVLIIILVRARKQLGVVLKHGLGRDQ